MKCRGKRQTTHLHSGVLSAGTKIHNLLFLMMDVARLDPNGNLQRQSNAENIRMKVCAAREQWIATLSHLCVKSFKVGVCRSYAVKKMIR